MKHSIFAAATLGLMICGGGIASAIGLAQSASPAAVDAVAHGEWQLREVGSSAAPRSLCISDPSVLLQIEHGQAHCNRFVLTDQPRAATVSYSCPGAGNGRTTIKLESANDFRLETQGINGGAPFDKAYLAHRTGDCAPAAR